jgi:hypothetical protein
MTTKKCSKCEIEKPLEEFSKKSKTSLRSRCKECMKVYLKEHYLNNKEYYIKKALYHNKRYKKNNQQFVWDYLKDHPCIDCGESDPIVLDFDHFRDKEHDVSSMTHRSGSIEKIQLEIQKCEVRCANCHRRKTAKEFGWYKNINI